MTKERKQVEGLTYGSVSSFGRTPMANAIFHDEWSCGEDKHSMKVGGGSGPSTRRGSKGGTFYKTSNGNPRYGTPPAGVTPGVAIYKPNKRKTPEEVIAEKMQRARKGSHSDAVKAKVKKT